MKLSFFPLGDTGLQMVFGNSISEKTNQQIRMFAESLKAAAIPGVTEWVPAYTTLSIYYRPDVIKYKGLQEKLAALYKQIEGGAAAAVSLVYDIPTYYGGETGPDLRAVAAQNGLSEEAVISIHTDPEYLIYMMGFVPGFPYLGGMSERIAAPRRETPRSSIPAGSVGIAGSQTGIYPLETPGGWQIIGQTPLKLYDPCRENPIMLASGHYLRFVPISKAEFKEIKEAVMRGEYQITARERQGDSDGGN